LKNLNPWILQWADDKYLVGQQLVTLTGHYGPDLEESVAIASFAQDHLGQALHLYRLICENNRQVDRLVYERAASDYRCCHLAESIHKENWAHIVLKGYLYEEAEVLRLQAVLLADLPTLKDMVYTMLQEEQYHVDHWQKWLSILAASPLGKQELQQALDELWPLCIDFFDNPAEKECLESGITNVYAEVLLPRWVNNVVPFLKSLNLKISSVESTELLNILNSRISLGEGGRRGKHLRSLEGQLTESHQVYLSDPSLVWG
jgi:ring-1,2-phenylacetyl-CoA epoxidase subunit PaaC